MSTIVTREQLNRPPRQDGAALLVTVILLALLSIVGLSALETAGLQARMATNEKERGDAFQAAEAGIQRTALCIMAHYEDDEELPDPDAVIDACEVTDAELPGLEAMRYSAELSVAGSEFGIRARGGLIDTPAAQRLDVYMLVPTPFALSAHAAYGCFGDDCTVDLRGLPPIIDGRPHLPLEDPEGCEDGCIPELDEDAPEEDHRAGLVVPDGEIDAGTGAELEHEFDGDPPVINDAGEHQDHMAEYPGRFTDREREVGSEAYWQEVIADLALREGDPVTFVEAGETLELAGNDVEYGVIVVKDGGHLDIGGDAYLEGMVLAEGGGTVTMHGTPTILGAMVQNAGSQVEIEATLRGTPRILYSGEVLQRLNDAQYPEDGRLHVWRDPDS